MNEGLDTGAVALQKKIPLSPETNAGELTKKLASLGSEAMVEALSSVEKGEAVLTEQDESKATYAAKLSVENRIILWSLPATRIHDQVRALTPGIGARTFHPKFDGPVKILRTRVVDEGKNSLPKEPAGSILAAKGYILVRCGEGVLAVEQLQVPGGRPVEVGEFLRGNKLGGVFTNLQA